MIRISHSGSWFRVLSWAIALWVGLLGCSAARSQSLTTLEYRVVGQQLTVTPASLSVPKGIAGSVRVDLSGQDIPAGALIQATLRGASIPTQTLVGAVNAPLLLPPIQSVGDYQLDQIRLVVPDASGTNLVTLLEARPASVPVLVFDEVLVSRVTSRPLTSEEIKDRGIFIDEQNFRAVEFEVGFVLEGKTIPVKFPVVAPAFRQSTEIIPAAELEARLQQAAEINQQLNLGASLPKELQVARVNMDIQAFNFQFVEEGESDLALKIPPIPALMVIPGKIGFLNQFFSVQIFTENAAPAGSGLSVLDVKAVLNLPPGPDLVPGVRYEEPGDDPLRFARVGSDKVVQRIQAIVRPGPDGKLGTGDDVARLQPGESGQAEFLVEGLQEGLHLMDLDLTANLEGLAAGTVRIKGKAAGSVLVRNPTFSMAFSHPRTIRSGEPYDAYVTVLNTSASPANGVSVTLPASSISGAVLESAATVQLGTVIPGQTVTAKFRLRSQRTGSISFSNLSTSDDRLQGRFRLRMGVDERGVALSPDTLVFPDIANQLPPLLVVAANRVLGQALSIATAGQLPPEVKAVSRNIITQRVLELAEAGQRIRYGDGMQKVLVDLLLDWQGGRIADEGFDAILRGTDAGREWREALAQELDLDEPQSMRDRLIARLPDVAGRGERWAIVAMGLELGDLKVVRGGETELAAADSAGTGVLAPSYNAPGFESGVWHVERATADIAFDWRITNAVPESEVDLGWVETNGTALHLAWKLPALPKGACVRFFSADTDRAMRVDRDCNGVVDATVLPVIQTIRELPPSMVSVRQDLGVLSGRPTRSCFLNQVPATLRDSGAESGIGNYATVLAVLFSKPMSQDTVNIPEAYQLDNGNRAGAVQIQPGGRVALLTMRQPVGGIRPRTMTLDGIADVRGNRAARSSQRVITDLDFGVAIQGQVVRGDGTAAVGVPVTLTMYDQMDAGLSGCLPFVVRVSQVFSDAQGCFSFDHVLPGIPYSVSATDTSGLSPETVQLILGATSADAFNRERLTELAASKDTQNSLLAEFAVGALPEAVAKAEGLDRALFRDLLPEDSARLGTVVPVALRFRGRGLVEGQVVASDGITPVPRAAVNLFPAPESRELGRGVFSDARGHFAFFGVPLGTFSIQADTGLGLGRTISGILTAPGQSNHVLVVLSALAESRSDLTGRVTENDNQTAHAGAQVFVGRYNDHSDKFEDVVAAVTADADGNWVAANIPARIYDVVAVSSDGKRKGEQRRVQVGVGVQNHIAIALQGFGVVVGRVELSDGRVVSNAIVAGGENLVRTDSRGVFRLTGVPTGFRTISAGVERSGEGLPPRSLPASPFPRVGSSAVQVLPGVDNFVVIRFEPKGTIQGTVRDAKNRPLAGGAVAIPELGGFRWVSVDSQGFYKFEGLEIGDHTLSAPAPPTENTDVSGLLQTLGKGDASEEEVRAAMGEALAIFTGANNPLLNGEGASFNPLSWGFIQVRLGRDGEVLNRDITLSGVSTISGRVLNGQGVPIGARVRLTGVGPAQNGAPSFVIRGERNSDPALGTFEFPGQALIGDWGLQAASPFFNVVISASGRTTRIDPDATNVVLQFPRDRETKGRIAGRVLNPDGTPVPVGSIVSIPFGTSFVTNRTLADGLFGGDILFPAIDSDGRTGIGYQIEAIDELSGRRGRSEMMVLPVVTNFVTIRLMDNAGGLRVRVLNADGTRASGARVDLEGVAFPFTQGLRLTTSSEGEVMFLNLFDGPYALSVQRNTGAANLGARGFGVAASGKTNEVTVVMGATATLAGQFVRRDGVTPIGFAQISVGNLGFANTGADGRFQMSGLPLGSYLLRGVDAVTGVGGVLDVKLTQQGETREVLLVEQSRGEIRGIVVRNSGTNTVSGLEVILAFTDGVTQARSVTSGPDGDYSFPGVPAGGFLLRAVDPVTKRDRVVSGELREGVPLVQLNLELEPLASLAVTLFEADGASPATNARVRALYPENQQRILTPDSSGLVTFTDLPVLPLELRAQSLAAGNLQNVVRGTVLLKTGVNITNILLRGVGSVSGRVVQNDGVTGVADAIVFLTSLADGFPEGMSRDTAVLTETNGEFEFEGVAVGDYRISAEFLTLSASVSEKLEFSGDSDELTLKLNPSGTIAGRIVRADGVTPVTDATVLVRFGNAYAAEIPDGTGAFRISNLPLQRLFVEVTAGKLDGRQQLVTELKVNGELKDLGRVILDEASPVVVSVTPRDSAREVSIETAVDLVLSEALDTNSVRESGIFLRQGTNRIGARVTLLSNPANGTLDRVRLTPVVPLISEKTYEVVIASGEIRDAVGAVIAQGPTDLVGRPLVEPFLSRFTTADQDPPDLLSVFPAPGTNQVELESVIRWTFNEPIRTSNVVVRLEGSSGLVSGRVAFGPGALSVVFAPDFGLKPNERFTLTLSNVLDLAGNRASGEPFITTFNSLDLAGPELKSLKVVGNRPLVQGSVVVVEAELLIPEESVEVSFGLNGNGIGLVTRPPFQTSLKLPESGSVLVSASAADRFGNRGTNHFLLIKTVTNQAPLLSLVRVKPGSGAAINGETVVIRVEASDDIEVARVLLAVSGPTTVVTNLQGNFPQEFSVKLSATLSNSIPLRFDARATDALDVDSSDVTLIVPVELRAAPRVLVPQVVRVLEGIKTNILVRASDPDGRLASLEVRGESLILPFESGFDATPAGLELRGDARVEGGSLILTRAVNGQQGNALVTLSETNLVLRSFQADFDLLIGGGNGADGFSFNYGMLAGLDLFGEDGAGDGLKLSFDTFDNGNDDGVGEMTVLYGNTRLARVRPPGGLRTGTLVPVHVEVRDSRLTLDHAGVRLVESLPIPGWDPQLGWQFGLAGRTGGFVDRHEVDNLSIRPGLGFGLEARWAASLALKLQMDPLTVATNATLELLGKNPDNLEIQIVGTDADGLSDEVTVSVVVLGDLDRDGIADDDDLDVDGDGLDNVSEVALGLNPRNRDTDGDSILDGLDPKPLVANRRPQAGVLLEAAGGAVRLDGVDDFISGVSYQGIEGNFTMELWVNPTGLRRVTSEQNSGAEAQGGMSYALFPRHGDSLGSGNHAGAGIAIGKNGVSVAEHAGSYIPTLLVHDAVLEGWNHVAVVYQTNRPSLFINGQFVRQGLPSTRIVHPSSGVSEFAPYGSYAGEMDEVRIWNRARSSAEIRETMNLRLTGTEPGLVSQYRFDESATDLVANSVVDGTVMFLGSGASAPLRTVSGATLFAGTASNTITALVSTLILGGSDPDGDVIHAVATKLPARGTLFQTLDGVTRGEAIVNVPARIENANGRVLLEREVGYNGKDEFRYLVHDGVTNSFDAVVNLEFVTPPDMDTDGDGIPDLFEIANGLNPRLNDSGLDLDRDGLSNLAEFRAGTRVGNPDTDGDGIPDGSDPFPVVAQSPTIPSADFGVDVFIHAKVSDPVSLSFAEDGTLFVGRDLSGSSSLPTASGDPVKIVRITAGGKESREYGQESIADPDSVFFDTQGVFSGVPGAVVVGGSDSRGGLLKVIRPDETVVELFGGSEAIGNPGPIRLDLNGQGLFMDFGPIHRLVEWVPGEVPRVLVNLSRSVCFDVDQLNRILVSGVDGVVRMLDRNGAVLQESFASGLNQFVFAVGRGGPFGTDLWGVREGGDLVSVSASGQVRVRATNVGTNIADARFGPDGGLYLADFGGDQILKVVPLPSTQDLWDVSQGVAVTGSSGVGAGPLENMFGASLTSPEPDNAFFADQPQPPAGFVHFVEWRTPEPIRLSGFSLRATDDGEVRPGFRAFSRFRLLGRDLATGLYRTLYETPIRVPYEPRFLSVVGVIGSFDGQEFRAEFVQHLSGFAAAPRLIELDGYGVKLSGIATPAPTGLAGWWTGDGTTALLNVVGTNHGEFQAGATLSQGMVRGAFALDGVDDRVRIPRDLLGMSGPHSVAAWVKPESAVSDPIGQELIFGQALGAPQLTLRSGANGLLRIGSGFRTTQGPTGAEFFEVVTEPTLPINAFSHVASVWNGQKLSIYLNGLEISSVTSLKPPLPSKHPYFVGGFGAEPETGEAAAYPDQQFMNGLVDEVMLFDRALTAEEVQRLAASGGAGVAVNRKVTLQNGTASRTQGGFSVPATQDGILNRFNNGWAPDHQPSIAVWESTQDLTFTQGAQLRIRMYQLYPLFNHTIGRFRWSYTTDARDSYADGLQNGGDVAANWTVLTPLSVFADNVLQFSLLEDGSVLAGNSTATTIYDVVVGLPSDVVTGLRLELMEHPSLPGNGPGFAGNKNLVLTELEAEVKPLGACASVFGNLRARWSMDGFSATVVNAIRGRDLTGDSKMEMAMVGAGRRISSEAGLATDGGGSLDIANNRFTLECWIRLEPNLTGEARNTGLVGKNGSSGVQPYLMLFGSGANAALGPDAWQMEYILTRADGVRVHNTSTGVRVPADNRYHHVAMTYDGGQVKLYVDGTLGGSFAFSGNLLSSPGEPFRIGGSVAFGIDELSLYERAFTEAEIGFIVAAGAAGICDEPLPQPTELGLGGVRISQIRIEESIAPKLAVSASAQDVVMRWQGTEAVEVEGSENLSTWVTVPCVIRDVGDGMKEVRVGIDAERMPLRFFRLRVK